MRIFDYSLEKMTERRKNLITLCLLLGVFLTLMAYVMMPTGHSLSNSPEKAQNQKTSGQEIEGLESMGNQQITKKDLMELLKEGKGQGYITGNVPSDPQELDRLAETILKEMSHQSPPQPTEGMTGRQQLVLRRDINGGWQESSDRCLPLFLDGPEWSALFVDVLGYDGGKPFVRGEDIKEWTKRHETEFQQSLPNYPMLGRIWDTYTDVKYAPEEITALKNECLSVKATTSNVKAVEGLRKLIFACDEATKSSLGLLLLGE